VLFDWEALKMKIRPPAAKNREQDGIGRVTAHFSKSSEKRGTPQSIFFSYFLELENCDALADSFCAVSISGRNCAAVIPSEPPEKPSM
jgi:hypothetical protein